MKRMIFKRIIILSMISVLVIGMVAGCGKKNKSSSKENETDVKTDVKTDVTNQDDNADVDDKDDNAVEDVGNEEGGVGSADDETADTQPEQTFEEYCAEQFAGVKRTMPYKLYAEHNPVMTQAFGADPYALVYDDTVYLYMTGDVLEQSGGKVSNNTYGKINTIHVVKSKDMVNWTDCGEIPVAGSKGVAKWAGNSWAPAICMKNVDGRDQFFLYFANGGGGIGVLVADHPEGPYSDPLGKALVTWSTPGVAGVVWLFDPAVFVDDDGTGYLYFGGGVPDGKNADPGTGRVVKLADDMIHLDGECKALDVPYLFEDSGINKIGNTYYYSYCSNWSVPSMSETGLSIESAQICYMTSKSPMGPFKLKGSLLRNPGDYFGVWGNNHHCLFEFKGQMYITYHSQILEKKMGYEGKGYRCTHIDKLVVNDDGTLKSTGTTNGVDQVCDFSLDGEIEAETMSTMGGIQVLYEKTTDRRVVGDIQSGDWIYLSNVDFAEGKENITFTAKAGNEDGYIEVRLDSIGGPVVGYVEITSGGEGYKTFTSRFVEKVSGVHNLLFTFCGEGYKLDSWNIQ